MQGEGGIEGREMGQEPQHQRWACYSECTVASQRTVLSEKCHELTEVL